MLKQNPYQLNVVITLNIHFYPKIFSITSAGGNIFTVKCKKVLDDEKVVSNSKNTQNSGNAPPDARQLQIIGHFSQY